MKFLKSYKKELEELKATKELDMSVLVNFTIGKGHLRLPKRAELEEAFSVMDADSMADGTSVLSNPVPEKLSWKQEKIMIDSIITRLNTVPMTKQLSVEQLLKLWELAHDRRKRQYILAAAGTVLVVGGIVLAKFFIDKKNAAEVESDDSDMDVDVDLYDQEIPEVEIDEIPEV